jgi:aryl-alcohol dehydrogenase-like predicted oxidoreductase
MEYRLLGRTGVKVSAFSLGALNFGPWGNDDQDDCSRIVHQALDAGVNLIDTADVYGAGRSEEIVGVAVQRRRHEVLLATKFHNPMGSGVNDRGNSRLWITRAAEGSLRRLQTDYIDVYQIHRPDVSTHIEETLSALSDLVRAGKVRYIACSTFPPFVILEALWASDRRGFERLALEQPPYSILARHAELDTFPLALRHGLGVLAWSPLAAGWLTGKYRKGEDMPEGSRGQEGRIAFMLRRFDTTMGENQLKFDLVERLARVADAAGISLSHMALAFAITHPAVTSVLLGPRNAGQLGSLLEAVDLRLDAATLDAIDEIVPPGMTINPADRGWDPPWMAPEARRR